MWCFSAPSGTAEGIVKDLCIAGTGLKADQLLFCTYRSCLNIRSKTGLQSVWTTYRLLFCSWNINYHKVTNKNKRYEFRRLYHDKQLFSNSMKPCENMTERNPYNEDLAPDHADTLRMGRAHMNAWKKTCIGKTFQTMSKHIWALIPLHKRKVCVDLRCQCWDFCPFIEKPSLAAVYVLN